LKFFFTNDISNERELEVLKYFDDSVTILTTSKNQIHPTFSKNKVIRKKSNRFTSSALTFMSKISFFISYWPDSSTNTKYLDRAGNQHFLIQLMLKVFLPLKSFFNKFLPKYFDVFQFLSVFSSSSKEIKSEDEIIFDPLIVRNPELWEFILPLVKRNSIRTTCFIRSFDNPFYSQLFPYADRYFVWGDEMKKDLLANHNIAGEIVIKGPYIFNKFHEESRRIDGKKNANNKPFKSFGYAVAFPDSFYAEKEKKFIKDLNIYLKKMFKDSVLFVRPYPSVNDSFYDELRSEGIKISNISGEKIDRYGNSKEKISFGNEIEKIKFLDSVDCFLSLATSFSIEAALRNIPIIHLDLSVGEFSEEYKDIKKYLGTTDHLKKYYQKLPSATSFKEISTLMRKKKLYNNSVFLEFLGFKC